MVQVSVGQARPLRRDRWIIRFHGDEIKRQEFLVKGKSAAEAAALDWAAYFEREGCKVSLSLPLSWEGAA